MWGLEQTRRELERRGVAGDIVFQICHRLASGKMMPNLDPYYTCIKPVDTIFHLLGEDAALELVRANLNPEWASEPGVSPDAGWGGVSLISLAAKKGDQEQVRCLLEAGADPDYTGPRYWKVEEIGTKTALMHASENGWTDIVRMLLDAGASTETWYSERGKKTALDYAANEEIVELLS